MKNLAGDPRCDADIKRELLDAGIQLVEKDRTKEEVPSTISGELGAFKFIRAWYYWIVEGKMPLEVARELYRDPVGKADVRVVGHCGCPSPDEPWIEWYDSEGRRIFPLSKKHKDFSEEEAGYRVFFEDPSSVGKGYIPFYHIDSAEGLKLFADAIRKHQLF